MKPASRRSQDDALLYPGSAVVVCADSSRRGEAIALARRLDLGLVEHPPRVPNRLAFVLTPERLQLQATGPDAPGAVYADFVAGATARRGRRAAQADEALVRAAGAGHGRRPTVIDATAGLGRDAWLLASLGCQVTLVERHPAVAALLADGLARAAADPGAAPVAARLQLHARDALGLLAEARADTVLVDPMHPPRRGSAAVKKEMRLLRDLVGPDTDSDRLLAAAIGAARRRVAVKRPRGAAALLGPRPSGSIAGRSTRFDIYAGQAPTASER